jgi:mercuric reductase
MSQDLRTYEIEGMTCDHCAVTLEKAFHALPGVERAQVSFADKRAVVTAPPTVSDALVLAAASAAGYRARPLSGHRDDRAATDRDRFDLVIVGSGGAAFGAAIRAAELGARVAMVERGTLGGTCVNVGCVPSKALLRAAEALRRAQLTPFAGLEVKGRLADFGRLQAQKDDLIGDLREHKYRDVLRGLDHVTLIEGHGEFARRGQLMVGDRTLRADRFLIATGARPSVPPVPGLADAGYLTSTEALALRELPASLLVLGGRYIALELAQAFARLGTKVTVLQRSGHILPTEDDAITCALRAHLEEEGLRIVTGVATRAVRRTDHGIEVDCEVGGSSEIFRAEKLLSATGRQPNTDRMGLDRVGVELTADGHIRVDQFLESTMPGVYAAGDVIGEPAFVYTAAWEGRLAAENALSGSRRPADYGVVPWVVFTDPQVAGVGLTEKAARAKGVPVDVTRLPLSAVPRALAARDTRGLIQLVKEQGGDRLLGATILAPEAGDLIMEPTLAIRYGIGVSQLASTFHPYLTQSEGIKLAAQTFTTDVKKLSCCAA